MAQTSLSNQPLTRRIQDALDAIDAQKLAGLVSVLLHVAVLAWAFTATRDSIGFQQPRIYMKVNLQTLPAPKAKKSSKAKSKAKSKANKKDTNKPKAKKRKAAPDLDSIAASVIEEETTPPPAPISPPSKDKAKAETDPGSVAGKSADAKGDADPVPENALLGVLPDWCPQDEALLAATVQEPALRAMYDIYISSIKNRVSDNWYIPPILAADAKCTIFIEQLVSGDIVRYEFAYCTGDGDFRRSVEEAIRRTTLPIPPDRRLYSRCIGFDFIPGEL